MKILIAQMAYLGDVVLSTPVIDGVLEIHPGAEVWVLTTPAAEQFFKYDPRVSGVLVFDKRGRHKGLSGLSSLSKELSAAGFDSAISVHRSIRTSVLLWLAKIPERIGFKDANGSFLYTKRIIRTQAPHAAQRYLSILSEEDGAVNLSDRLKLFPPSDRDVDPLIFERFRKLKDYVVLFPGSSWETKRWASENYSALIHLIEGSGMQTVVLGSSAEAEICAQAASGNQALNLAGSTSLSDSLWVMASAKACICNDSMALHMSSALEIPTLAVYCSTTPDFGFGPWKNTARIAQLPSLPCMPCGRHGRNVCPTGTNLCMTELLPDEVYGEFQQLLRDASGAAEINEKAAV